MKSAFGYMQSFGSVLLIQIITNPSLIYVSVTIKKLVKLLMLISYGRYFPWA